MKGQYNRESAAEIARAMRRAWGDFPERKFLKGIGEALDPLELKARMHLLADRLECCMPAGVPEMFRILTTAVEDEDGLRGFLVWPLTEVVSRRGLPFFGESMAALREMTIRFTAEFAIRRFLREMPERTLAQMAAWCSDPNEHVRRLASEGSRPFLPWGGNIAEFAEPPFPTLGLLDALHADESDYVRLSVANHLNDISKVSPETVLETVGRWGTGDTRAKRLARHACRTLLKQGHPGALLLHGYGGAGWEVSGFSVSSGSVAFGGTLPFSFTVRNTAGEDEELMFDYTIHYQKADGRRKPKVFKGRTLRLAAGEARVITARHVFRMVTTRRHYPGWHAVEIFLNGRSFGQCEFLLTRE